MKKQNKQSPPVVGEAFLKLIITRFDEVAQEMSQRKQTKAQKNAAQILSRCLDNRYGENHPLPFGGAGKKEGPQPWLSGDLAIGRGGPEFMYVYSPIRFVEGLLAEAIKVASAPIKVPSKGQTKESKLSTRAARDLAETFTTAGVVYLLNNLRAKLDEAVEDLFAESRAVVDELYWTTLDSSLSELSGVERDPVQTSQSRFTRIIQGIVAEGDARRRKRLRAAFWEIARGRGRPKGAIGSKAPKKLSRKEFLMRLNQKIRELSASEAAVTRKAVANALGFSNEKAFDRQRRQLGDGRRWREYVAGVSGGD